ncbi:hypothetical protein BDP81DRAFT_189591 [Colletotrichum phormii]|uniref:Uncharacterized protein n=1 Tax=Colletotrichum phormii TaxID=359342 RepID=A0AAI9ZXG9_9PEZI|nr:uncharacterized protein BDP81DRAFT_189591 [Colletotrichum phormii]KAK1638654.1 hypothetical protein BDP81DRAFT_189591 [Colletotrichum phormii]
MLASDDEYLVHANTTWGRIIARGYSCATTGQTKAIRSADARYQIPFPDQIRARHSRRRGFITITSFARKHRNNDIRMALGDGDPATETPGHFYWTPPSDPVLPGLLSTVIIIYGGPTRGSMACKAVEVVDRVEEFARVAGCDSVNIGFGTVTPAIRHSDCSDFITGAPHRSLLEGLRIQPQVPRTRRYVRGG